MLKRVPSIAQQIWIGRRALLSSCLYMIHESVMEYVGLPSQTYSPERRPGLVTFTRTAKYFLVYTCILPICHNYNVY